MAAEFVCDGCGKREPGRATRDGWRKPLRWFERQVFVDPHGELMREHVFDGQPLIFATIHTACSRDCVEVVAAKTGLKSMVMERGKP